MRTLLVLLLMLLPSTAWAQVGPDRWARDHLRWTDHEKGADIASTVLVGVALALPCLQDRTWRCVGNEGVQVGIAVGGLEVTKRLVHRGRPNAHDGKSFPSLHTALACATSLNLGYWTLCPAVGYLRVAADWHWSTDTMAGAGAGAMLATIRWGK